MQDFFPDEIKTEATSNYTRFANGKTRVRMLGTPVFGWETWKDKKPVRFELDQKIPVEKIGEDGVKQFMAIKVYNYNLGCVQVMQITQKTILKAIKDYSKNSDYGNPTGYDIEVTKTGEGMGTKYTVIASPPKPLTAEVKKADDETEVEVQLLLIGSDPFLN